MVKNCQTPLHVITFKKLLFISKKLKNHFHENRLHNPPNHLHLFINKAYLINVIYSYFACMVMKNNDIDHEMSVVLK